MKNLLTNKNNLSKTIKKGLSIVLATTLVGTFTGCSNKQKETTTNTQTFEKVYDFNIINEYNEEETEKTYNWSKTKEILENKNKEFVNLFDTSYDENNISKNKYELALFEVEDKFGELYYRVVDNKGYYINDKKYSDIQVINNEYVLLTKDTFDDYNNYILFNKVTGETKEICAKYITSFNNYLITTAYDQEEKETYYELLNANGTKVNNKRYSNYTYDEQKNTIFLYSYQNKKTEVFDTITKKARRIDGNVESAENGYLIIKKPRESTLGTYGVYYLEKLDADLEEIISDTQSIIFFATRGRKKPIFEICTRNEDTKKIKSRYADSTGKLLETEEYDSSLFSFYPDDEYLIAYNHCEDKATEVYDILNQYGAIEVDDIEAQYISTIPLTSYINYKDNIGKIGIMDFNKNIIQEPIYDQLFVSPIYTKGLDEIVDCYIIGRIEETNTTIALTKDLTEIAKGDYSYEEITEIATKAIGKISEDAKILIK